MNTQTRPQLHAVPGAGVPAMTRQPAAMNVTPALRAAVAAFVKPDYDPHEVGYTKALPPLLMVVHGEQGMGKTRLLHEWKEKEDVDFYYGDFNEDLEGAAAMYNPFKEAFEGDGKLVEGKAYFEDRSEMGRKLTGLVAKAAGSSVPLDLESLLAADGDQHTVDEISQDLTERLVAKAEAGRTQLVVIDHYDWVETDPASHNLMKAMLERLMRESQHVERLRVILITDKGDEEWPEMSKADVARQLATRIADALKGPTLVKAAE